VLPSPEGEAFATAIAERRDKENAIRQFRLHLIAVAAGALALSASLWPQPSLMVLVTWAFHLVSVIAGVLSLHWLTTYDLALQTLEVFNIAGARPADPKMRPKPRSWHLRASRYLYAVQLVGLLLGLALLATARFL
jgi:hypothetical protein